MYIKYAMLKCISENNCKYFNLMYFSEQLQIIYYIESVCNNEFIRIV